MKLLKTLSTLALLASLSYSCADKNEHVDGLEYLPIYIGREVSNAIEATIQTVPVIDKFIPVNDQMNLEKKLTTVSEVLSKEYFQGLKINVKLLAESKNLVLHIDLIENDAFESPGSQPFIKSWYDFFQGSTGGLNTTITLKETFLQKHYKGEWPDVIVFYYQGNEMEEWDHVSLSGKISRY